MIQNAAIRLVKEVFETSDIKEVAAKLSTGEWIVFAAAPLGDGAYLFAMGRVPA